MSNIEQDTPQWLAWRSEGIGSSDTSAMMMLSKYKTIDQLWEEKVTGIDNFKGNFATERGKELEPIARDIYEFEFKIEMIPMVFVHPRFSYMRYSSDGYNKELNYNVEFKCPLSKKAIEEAKEGKVPEQYWSQTQWGLFVTGTDFIDYGTYDGQASLSVTRIFKCDSYARALQTRARWFWRKVTSKKEITKEEKEKCLNLNKKLFTSLAIRTETLLPLSK